MVFILPFLVFFLGVGTRLFASAWVIFVVTSHGVASIDGSFEMLIVPSDRLYVIAKVRRTTVFSPFNSRCSYTFPPNREMISARNTASRLKEQ